MLPVRIGGLLLAVSVPWFCGCSSAPEPARTQPAAAAPRPARIVHFYASPGLVERGGSATVCYGVENARAVRIEPAVETLGPSPNRCFTVSPRQDTRYTLIAEGVAGAPASQSLAIRVKARAAAPPAVVPLITLFAAAATEVAAGQPVTVCYGVRGAASVRLEPEGRALPPSEKQCFNVQPSVTTTYTLVVSGGAGGRSEREQIVIRVK